MSKTDYDLCSMLGNKLIAAELKHNSVGIKEVTVFSDQHIGAITKEKNARSPLKIGPLFFLRGEGGGCSGKCKQFLSAIVHIFCRECCCKHSF